MWFLAFSRLMPSAYLMENGPPKTRRINPPVRHPAKPTAGKKHVGQEEWGVDLDQKSVQSYIKQ